MFTTTANRAVTATLFGSFDSLGLTPPEPVAAARDRLASVTAAYDKRPGADSEALALAVIAALEAGTDPASDPGVQRIATASTLDANHGLRDSVGAILFDQLRTACATHADAIVDAWRPTFDGAATALTDAHDILGAIDLTDTAAVVHKGPAGTTAWAAATTATATIGTVVAGWSALSAFLSGNYAGKRHALLVIADVDLGVWVDEDLDGASSDVWAALIAGHALDLATIAGHGQRVAALDLTRAERQAQADQRRPHRTIPPAAA